MGFIPPSSRGNTDRTQIGLNALGLLNETFPPLGTVGAQAYTSQAIYGSLLGLRAGDTVTGIAMAIAVAAAGTGITHGRAALLDVTGKVVARSADLNTAASWTLGITSLPLSYVVPADGGYYACYFLNGAFGTTQPTFWRGNTVSNTVLTALPGAAIPAFVQVGQADVPAVGSNVTITVTSNFGWYMGVVGTPVAS